MKKKSVSSCQFGLTWVLSCQSEVDKELDRNDNLKQIGTLKVNVQSVRGGYFSD
jgi:hypothetical protein